MSPTAPVTTMSLCVRPPVRRVTLEYVQPDTPTAIKRAITTDDITLVYRGYAKKLPSGLFWPVLRGRARLACQDDDGIHHR